MVTRKNPEAYRTNLARSDKDGDLVNAKHVYMTRCLGEKVRAQGKIYVQNMRLYLM